MKEIFEQIKQKLLNWKYPEIPSCDVCGKKTEMRAFYKDGFHCISCLINTIKHKQQTYVNDLAKAYNVKKSKCCGSKEIEVAEPREGHIICYCKICRYVNVIQE